MKVKNRVRLLIILLTFSIFIVFNSSTVYAITQDSAPYQTYTEGADGFVLTQTAYEPTGGLVLETNLSAPEDMFIKDEYIYIADTGNKRIIKTDFKGTIHLEIKGLFSKPMGVHVDNNDVIYVADPEKKLVFKFDEFGNLLSEIGRPDVPLFGNSPFEPVKIVSGPRDILYIASIGSTNGLIQLNGRGEFLSFYGANPTKVSLWQRISSFFGVQYARTIPASVENLAIDEKGSIFTVSKTTEQKIKKFNISSKIVMSIENENTPIAIKVNDFGNIYTISEQGIINEYDSYGNLIFQFGAIDSGNQVLGRFVNPIDIEIDGNNNILVLDKGSNQVQILEKSEFAGQIHQGLINYKNGIYDIDEWAEVLRMNGFFNLANKSIANALYRGDRYDEALEYFEIANDKEGYSEAFWQVRYNWLQSYLPIVFIILIGLFILSRSLRLVDNKYHIYNPIRTINQKVKEQKVVKESSYLFKILRHPIETVYNLKVERKAGVLTATLIYLAFGILTLISLYTTGFIFNNANLDNYGALKETIITVGIVLLFVVANHLISSLQSGEGWFRDIYVSVAFALSPVLLSIIPAILFSHVLTLNELFIYQVFKNVAWGWSIILIVIMIKEVHNYTFKELIINLLLTIFTMLMIILIAFLIYILSLQLLDYVSGLIREVIIRVQS